MIKHTLYIDAQSTVTSTFVEYTDKDKSIVYMRTFDSECMSAFQCGLMSEHYGVGIARIITPE